MIWYAPLHSWLSLGLCTVFKHTSTSCDPALKETKALFTLSAAHTWSKPWLPGSLHSMACVPQEHTNRDHTAVLWEKIWHFISLHCSLQLEVSISSLSQHLCQNALAPGMADNHQHPPPEVTKKNKGVQRLLQKHTASALPIASSVHHVSPTTENLMHWGCQSQLKLGLWMATHRCLLEPALARWCLLPQLYS